MRRKEGDGRRLKRKRRPRAAYIISWCIYAKKERATAIDVSSLRRLLISGPRPWGESERGRSCLLRPPEAQPPLVSANLPE